jgi:NADP-dependent 3-hydroxy acid dehydrogenase YdfG
MAIGLVKNGQHDIARLDMSDKVAWYVTMEEIGRDHRQLDILVNAARTARVARIADTGLNLSRSCQAIDVEDP